MKSMQSFGARVVAFNCSLWLDAPLPEGVSILNPFRDSPLAQQCCDAFYAKFYGDDAPRIAILGNNPGRHGGGLTGIPFTDFKRLREDCGIDRAAYRRTSLPRNSSIASFAPWAGRQLFTGSSTSNRVPFGLCN